MIRTGAAFVAACVVGAGISIEAWAQRGEVDISIDSAEKPYTSLEVNDDPANFQFVVVTDRTGGHRDGIFEDGVAKINLLQPELVMSVGDLIEGYTEDLGELNKQWDEFESFTARLEMPFFYVPGNHDITNAVMANLWESASGSGTTTLFTRTCCSCV